MNSSKNNQTDTDSFPNPSYILPLQGKSELRKVQAPMVQVQHVSPLAVINIERENEGNRIWRNIRQRGDLTCHGVSIPKKCSNGICDNYPEVKLCTTCKRCPCDY